MPRVPVPPDVDAFLAEANPAVVASVRPFHLPLVNLRDLEGAPTCLSGQRPLWRPAAWNRRPRREGRASCRAYISPTDNRPFAAQPAGRSRGTSQGRRGSRRVAGCGRRKGKRATGDRALADCRHSGSRGRARSFTRRGRRKNQPMRSDPLGAGARLCLKNISTNEIWQHSALSRRGAPAGEMAPYSGDGPS